MFLKHYADKCEIVYYKEPSRVYNVSYKKITNDLWNTNISDHPPEDAKAKKLIANVNLDCWRNAPTNRVKALPTTVLEKHCIINNRWEARSIKYLDTAKTIGN